MGGIDIQFTPKVTTHNSYYWQFGDGNNSSQTNPSHTYANAGTFSPSLQVTDANSCKETSQQSIVLVSTDVFTLSLAEGLGVRPNPFTNQLTLSGNIPNGQVKLDWMDATGRLVFTTTGNAQQGTLQLESGQLPVHHGLYLLQLQTRNNELKTLRLVKE